jgi:hypothetical protein
MMSPQRRFNVQAIYLRIVRHAGPLLLHNYALHFQGTQLTILFIIIIHLYTHFL